MALGNVLQGGPTSAPPTTGTTGGSAGNWLSGIGNSISNTVQKGLNNLSTFINSEKANYNAAKAANNAATVASSSGTYKGSSASGIGSSGTSSTHSSALNNLQAVIDQNNALYHNSALQQMEYNSSEAQKNRDWQERMSSTAYQRAVKDLKAAGLNPVLAAWNGGAATTSGSSAHADQEKVDDSMSSALIALMTSLISANSAMSVASTYAGATRYAADQSLKGSQYIAFGHALGTASRFFK